MKHLILLTALRLSHFFIYANNDTLPKPYITKPPPEITPSFAIGLQASFTFGFAKYTLDMFGVVQRETVAHLDISIGFRSHHLVLSVQKYTFSPFPLKQ